MRINQMLLAALIMGCSLSVCGQAPTVGLMTYGDDAFPGYTLFAALSDDTQYLIDNCGNVVHTWNTGKVLGNSMYLLPDGNLLKTTNRQDLNTSITGAGGGEGIQLVDWDSNILWEYTLADDEYRLHHDIERLPNGNILLLAWEHWDSVDARDAGRDPALIQEGRLWPEAIFEIRPSGAQEAEIVWEWHLKDHLVQDHDSTKPNFALVKEHPELMDLNFVNQNMPVPGEADWIHYNAIDYNAELDQIALSSQRISEIYIIDHSTTTQEAAGHTGGRWGKGGDFLYRWGNPAAYGAGSADRQMLGGQHDVKWIEEGLPGEGALMILNNGNHRSPGFTSVDVIRPDVDSLGNYVLAGDTLFGPEVPEWTYAAPTPTDMYSWFISGSQRLPNGNTLICSGAYGEFVEVDDQKREVWRYVNPVTHQGIVNHGDTIPSQGFAPGNAVFRCERYALDFPAFGGRDLSPKGRIEGNAPDDGCRTEKVFPVAVIAYPNPADQQLTVEIENVFGNFAQLRMYSLTGQLVWQKNVPQQSNTIDVSTWRPGMYILRIGEYGWKKVLVKH